MTEEEFKRWYNLPLYDGSIYAKEITFKEYKIELFKFGKGHERLWLKDYIIWKLSQ